MRWPFLSSCDLGRATIWDDSSPPRQVSLWSAWQAQDGASRAVCEEIAQRFARRVHPSETETPGPEFAVSCLGLLAIMAVVIFVGWRWSVHSWWILVPLIPAWIISMAIARIVFLRRTRQELRTLLLARGLCASCGYSLGEIAGQPGGLTVCPECGAAWRLGGDAPVEEVRAL